MSVRLPPVDKNKNIGASQYTGEQLSSDSKKIPISVPGRKISNSVISSQSYMTSIPKRRGNVQLPEFVRPVVIRQSQVVQSSKVLEQPQDVMNEKYYEEKIAKTQRQIQKAEKQHKKIKDQIYSLNNEEKQFHSKMIEILKNKFELQKKLNILTEKKSLSENLLERSNLQFQIKLVKELILNGNREQAEFQGYINNNRQQIPTLLYLQRSLQQQKDSLVKYLVKLRDSIWKSPHQQPTK